MRATFLCGGELWDKGGKSPIAGFPSIAFFIGLTGFALTVIACDLVFLSGPLDRAVASVRVRLARGRRTTGEPATPAAKPPGDSAGEPATAVRESAVSGTSGETSPHPELV
ncbi:hypothetical protein [Streptomyces sp. NBC_01314]|uniref:hypothetical protein n=1 Tax=Streptomyces sp. NBC_01314 TaxID=2903821 RepID=UPI003086EA9C|nr:hypothetical protein OG622_27910 [Streptomyces sp. NBC_01314]